MNRGDSKAGELLYKEFAPYIYTICRRYNVSSYKMKDMMQSIFMECFASLKKYDPIKGEFKFWLRRLAINQILNDQKKWQDKTIHLGLQEFLMTDENQIINILSVEEILTILEDMPSTYAQIFNLFVIDGYSHKEIAAMLNVNENTTRSYVKRGREWAKLRLAGFLKNNSKIKKNEVA